MIGRTVFHYKILAKLGEGGMGLVYKAKDTKLDRLVALKFLQTHLTISRDDRERFLQEAKLASSINHPNVLVIYDIKEYVDPATTNRQQFLIMEYVDGVTVSEIIKEKQLKPKEVVTYALQVAEALQEAHSSGIIHRDIKSSNIMVNKRDQIKVMDFGLAKLKGSIGLTKASTTLGTAAYMAPEQVLSEEVDHRADIWSFGIVLYEMITGQLPFRGDYEQALLYDIVNEEPDLSSIKELEQTFELGPVIRKALEKNKENRYAQMKHIIDELSSIKKKMDLQTSVDSDPNASVTSIAVLPFVDMSPQGDQEYFCDGISDEIITSLSHLKKLKVVARTSSFAFKGKQMDVREIGQKLNVDHILEGSIRKAGNRLRITAQLIQVSDGFHLWSDRFDRDLEDVFVIQDEISLAITDNLKMKLIEADRANVTKSYTENLDAYNNYLMGRYIIDKGRKTDLLKGLSYFEKALEADPNYAQGYGGVAITYYLLGLLGCEMPAKVFPQAKEYAQKALQIDDTFSEAHSTLGLCKMFHDWDWPGAGKEFQLALLLNPNSSSTYLAFSIYYAAIGKLEEAVKAARKCLELDPRSIRANEGIGMVLLRAGQYREAKKHLQKVTEMEPNIPLPHFISGQVDMKESRCDQGVAQIEKAAALEGDNPMVLSALGWAYGLAGRKKQAQQILARLRHMSKDRYISGFLFAKIYAGLRDNNRAFQYLEKAYQQHAMSLAVIFTDETVENLRSDPRFRELLKRINLDKYVLL
jgi:serine/threonine protein kinase/Flp pilus assembly protein TadD